MTDQLKNYGTNTSNLTVRLASTLLHGEQTKDREARGLPPVRWPNASTPEALRFTRTVLEAREIAGCPHEFTHEEESEPSVTGRIANRIHTDLFDSDPEYYDSITEVADDIVADILIGDPDQPAPFTFSPA